MSNKNLIIIALVAGMLVLAGIYFVRRGRAVQTSAAPVDELDMLIAENQQYTAQQQAAYDAGRSDAGNEWERRARAALLTGGFSEIGNALGIKF